MSARAIREYDGKKLLYKCMNEINPKLGLDDRIGEFTHQSGPKAEKWMQEENTKMVIKPDQLIKRRGKMGLVKVNKTLDEVTEIFKEWDQKEIDVQNIKGILSTFIVEPFVAHDQTDEYYLCIRQTRDNDEILFYSQGGVDVGDVESKAKIAKVDLRKDEVDSEEIKKLVSDIPKDRQEQMIEFICTIYKVFTKLYFTYLEINPIVMTKGKIYILDLAAKLDQTAAYQAGALRGDIDYPAPWGRQLTKEEEYIMELDSQTGASLKLTILNPKGKVWLMVAGGGASVIYTDTVSDLGFAKEIANYGEYSGDPSEQFTYKYAKTIMSLMTRGDVEKDGKVLIIGGGIANFTNVAATFKGIIRAIEEYQDDLKKHHVRIFVRRGGPNYREGLAMISKRVAACNIPIKVYGPELHMTAVVAMALGKDTTEPVIEEKEDATMAGFDEALGVKKSTKKEEAVDTKAEPLPKEITGDYTLFTRDTRCIIVGFQPRPVQSMLDFDDICGRDTPSVAAIVYHTPRSHKVFWKSSEILIPMYKTVDEAVAKHPDVTVAVNLESQRSAFKSTMQALNNEKIKVIAIIAEGIPERNTRQIIQKAEEKKVTIIGPATVGGIKPGCFRIGNTGGMIDNVISSKLYRPGSVAYVSRSGGMSNELNNIVSCNSDGVYEGIAIGGDRFPGSTFIEHIERYEKDPQVKMIVVLGEHGGKEEYKICDMIKKKQITKPLVVWCIGTCAKLLGSEVQFGHAGASANDDSETAETKNKALKDAGAYVPQSFNELGTEIRRVYDDLVTKGVIKPRKEPPVPKVKLDVAWATSLGLIRKPTSFICTISDDRGDEVIYGTHKLSECFAENVGIGGVISLLWFKKLLPKWATDFFEVCLMMVADHGPAVSGAHNTIVASRAGKDLISSLVSGLLCIGPRFGGAIDDAAMTFSEALKKGMCARDLVESTKIIPGIGHRVKSKDNPDKRVTILTKYIEEHFPQHKVFDYAREVEDITTQKKATLILNVDGTIGVSLVDLFYSCRDEGLLTNDEVETLISCKVMNGIFVIGRSIGLIGHYLDQKRLNTEMYRHPTDDILYSLPKK